MRASLGLLALLGTLAAPAAGQAPIDGRSPSRSLYFDWINSQYEGTTEEHTLANMAVFQWLHDEYGMELDLYSLDVGNVDDGPYTAGVGRLIPAHYGTLESPSFREQFPRGFAPLSEAAAGFGARLGIWLGPDGFGDTPQEEAARSELLVSLVRDHGLGLFKLDAVAGNLRPEKQDALARALARCREIRPDLVVLNERVEMGRAAEGVTTNLWAGQETYIDVFNWNEVTAPHHRAGALARGLPPGLDRTFEDHGVCLSSCLEGWDDDLVLQAFNRASLLAPEVYGSPWFLRDDELARMARLFNLHRRFRHLLIDAVVLPEERYGPFAVARGDGAQRFVTLRNLTWDPARVQLRLDETLGLTHEGPYEVRRLHPREAVLGRLGLGQELEVEVEPFRACLLAISARPLGELALVGCEYEVVRDVPGRPALVDLLGAPGTSADVVLDSAGLSFGRAELDGEPIAGLVEGERVEVAFPGQPLRAPWRRRLGALERVEVPVDAEALFEATCFAADSDALELRALARSGSSWVPQVEAARRAFLAQPMFVNRGIDDAQLFDPDLETFFIAREPGGVLRLDLGRPQRVDEVRLRTRGREAYPASPELESFADDARAEVSSDLRSWTGVPLAAGGRGTIAVARTDGAGDFRYVRVHGAPRRLAEVEGWSDGEPLDRAGWRASNLLPPWHPAIAAWSRTVTVDEVVPTAFLAVAVNGHHGAQAAWVAARVGDELVGFPDRAPSYPSNTWEYRNVEPEADTTHYLPLRPEWAGRPIEVVLLVLEGGEVELRPELHLSAREAPLVRRRLVLRD